MPARPIESYRIVAKNPAKASENRIHDDEVAKEHGFAGGLVPGVTTYGYLLRPVIDELGLSWLEHGSASIKLLAPVYEGEELWVRGDVDHAMFTLRVEDRDGKARATGGAVLAASPPVFDAADLALFPRKPLCSPALQPTPQALEGIEVLGALEFRFDDAAEQLLDVDDDTPLYATERVMHPVLLLGSANFALAANVALGPWIHVASEVQSFRAIQHGDFVSVRGRIVRLFRKKDRELVELDLVYVVNGEQAASRVRHTAIYRL